MTSGDIRRVLGLSRKTLCEWKAKGVLRPAEGGNGSGNTGFYHVRDVLAIAIGLNLRGRGFSVPQIGRVVNWLLSRSLESLKADFASGRRLMAVVGDRIQPALLTDGQVYDNPEVDLPAIFRLGLPVAIVDVQEAYRLLLERVAASRHEDQHEHRDDWLINRTGQNPKEGGTT